MQLLGQVYNALQAVQEPLVNLGQFIDAVNGVTLGESLADSEQTLVGRLLECLVQIIELDALVLNESVHALADHADTLLDNLLKATADRHNLTYRLH